MALLPLGVDLIGTGIGPARHGKRRCRPKRAAAGKPGQELKRDKDAETGGIEEAEKD